MLNKNNFRHILNGKEVSLFQLKSKSGMQVSITNYGCRMVGLLLKNKENELLDVVVGFDTLDGYLTATEVYHGAIIGRYANRIANGKFILDNKEYQLPINNGINHLHGGPHGFHTKVWEVEEVKEDSISLYYLSVDGEEGYPGNLKVKIVYSLSEQNELTIQYEASTDKTTILNLTNHAYFNLNGQGNGTILNHQLLLNADWFTPVNENLIPTGAIQPVKHTPFDFTTLTTIGKRINDEHVQLKYGNGYDHNYALKTNEKKIIFCAKAIGDISGIEMEVFTDQPGVQFYTGNFMAGKNNIKQNATDGFRTAFCLETQHFPDSPNHPHFPSVLLQKNTAFISTTLYKFSI